MDRWTDYHSRLHHTLKQRALLPPHSRILVAVSGGQDSLCLLKLLRDLRGKWGWSLAIAHCDHGWPLDRGMADHVAHIAQRWQLPFFLRQTENLPQTEAAARTWRYQVLTQVAATEAYGVVVTGHTQSDRAETLLYNLLRGSGSQGLGSLSWRRSLGEKTQLVRPLLGFQRRETGQFCQTFNLPLWEDPLNQQRRFARNRLRLDVIPYLETHLNPQTTKHLAQLGEQLATEAHYLDGIAQEYLVQCHDPPQKRLQRSPLQPLHKALQRRIIRKFLQYHLPQAVSFDHIEAITQLLHAPNRSSSSTLAQGQRIIVVKPWLVITSAHT